jgi:3,4-dihydroxy 2-butanone 4-phosphate synthase/GTP cyclohydrolase II
VHGRIGEGRDVLVRLHRSNVVADVIEGGRTIEAVMRRFAQEGRGVLVYLRDGTAGVPLSQLPDAGEDGAEAARVRQWREVGLGAQILRDLGVVSIRNISSAARSYVGLSGFGIEMVGDEALEG